MGASDVGDGHRCRRSRTSWEELEDRADGGGLGGVAKARSGSTKCALSRRFPPQNHPNFSLISSVRKRLFCSGGRLVLPPGTTAQQPSEHVFVHDPSSACCGPPHQVRVSLFSLILGFSIRIHASTQEPSRVTGRGPLIEL